MPGISIDRRFLIVPGAIFVVLVVLSGFVSVVNWQADLSVTDQNVETADVVTINHLPKECRPFAQSLTGSQNVSIEEYRVELGSIGALLRRTPAEGWSFGDSSCSARLAFQDNFHAGDRAYNIEGRYRKSKLHQKPVFRYGQVLGGLAGFGMLFIGYREFQNSDAE